MFSHLFPHGHLSVLDSPSHNPSHKHNKTHAPKLNTAHYVRCANFVHVVFFAFTAFIAFVAFKEYLFTAVFLWALFSTMTFFSGGLLATFKPVRDYGFSMMVFSFSLPIFIIFTAFTDFMF